MKTQTDKTKVLSILAVVVTAVIGVQGVSATVKTIGSTDVIEPPTYLDMNVAVFQGSLAA